MSAHWIERRGVFWSATALIAVLFLVRNLPFHLDDYEQAKQAFTSFEMVQEGHWLYQHTPNEKIATKPPLVGWISAAVFGVTRSWEIAWRLPSLAAAILLLVALSRNARAAYGFGGALLALGAFGLNMLSPRLATLVRTDMALALVVFLIGVRIWRKTRAAGEAWETWDRVIMCALLTAAMLIKGPVVGAFLLPGIAAFQWLKRDRNVSAWFGWWPWLAALAVFGLWVAGGVAWVPGFYEQVVLREFAGRFSETVHRPQPIYFYLPHLLHKLAPWSLLLLVLGVIGWRADRGVLRERWQRLSPEVAWLVCWIAGGLLVMSFVPSKRVDRIFPLVPPLCLLLAAQYARLQANANLAAGVRRWSALTLVIAALCISGYVASQIVESFRAREGALADFGAAVRKEAAARGWRYEVIGGKEEGLLLYLRKTHFVSRTEALTEWNAHALDALVAPTEELALLLAELSDASVSPLEATVTINDRPRRYIMVVRKSPLDFAVLRRNFLPLERFP